MKTRLLCGFLAGVVCFQIFVQWRMKQKDDFLTRTNHKIADLLYEKRTQLEAAQGNCKDLKTENERLLSRSRDLFLTVPNIWNVKIKSTVDTNWNTGTKFGEFDLGLVVTNHVIAISSSTEKNLRTALRLTGAILPFGESKTNGMVFT